MINLFNILLKASREGGWCLWLKGLGFDVSTFQFFPGLSQCHLLAELSAGRIFTGLPDL